MKQHPGDVEHMNSDGTWTKTHELRLVTSWWVRYFMLAGFAWYRLTLRTVEYNKLTNFAVKYGMKIKAEKICL